MEGNGEEREGLRNGRREKNASKGRKGTVNTHKHKAGWVGVREKGK